MWNFKLGEWRIDIDALRLGGLLLFVSCKKEVTSRQQSLNRLAGGKTLSKKTCIPAGMCSRPHPYAQAGFFAEPVHFFLPLSYVNNEFSVLSHDAAVMMLRILAGEMNVEWGIACYYSVQFKGSRRFS